MPEGDSLHRLALRLQPLVGETVEALILPRSTQPTSHLTDKRIERIEAFGKNLLVHFEGAWMLHVHLMMKGRFRLYARSERERFAESTVVVIRTAKHEAVCTNAPVVQLAREGSLQFVHGDVRSSIGPDLIRDEDALEEAVTNLMRAGDEVLGVALMNQRLVAGIGNIWKSELLFQARLNPFARVSSFTRETLLDVLTRGRTLMQANVDGSAARGLSERDRWQRVTRLQRRPGEGVLAVYQRRGEACYACGGTIQSRQQNVRWTYFCPRCQRCD
jgi:endonuclease-8